MTSGAMNSAGPAFLSAFGQNSVVQRGPPGALKILTSAAHEPSKTIA